MRQPGYRTDLTASMLLGQFLTLLFYAREAVRKANGSEGKRGYEGSGSCEWTQIRSVSVPHHEDHEGHEVRRSLWRPPNKAGGSDDAWSCHVLCVTREA
jgi:hypothetical protein